MEQVIQDSNIIISLILLLILLAMKSLAFRLLTRIKSLKGEALLEWKVFLRNTTVALFLIGLSVVWATEIRTFALSLVAIAAAVVIATKELILCLLGGLLKSLSRPFKVGDRIEVGSYRGDVIDHDFLTITLREIGPGRSTHQYTGRRVFVPNSLLLNNPVLNETKKFKYGLHSFSVFVSPNTDVRKHKQCLMKACEDVCAEYVEKAQKYLTKLGEEDGLKAPSAGPRVSYSFVSHDKVELIVRVPIPSLKSALTEQAILEKYLEYKDMPKS